MLPMKSSWGCVVSDSPWLILYFSYFSRLSRELPDEKESEVLQDSLDRFYSTPSGYLELPDLCQPYSSAFYSWEEQHLGLALDVDRIKKDQEEEEDQGPPCPRLSSELLEVVEPEDLQDSLDRCYSTPSSYLEQPDSWQPYESSFYSLEEEHIGFSLDVDGEYLSMKVIRIH
ncbi:neuroblastoma breakpoint family member 15-like [Hylobates moloch]|uniref:neuroblastoma breakpoint family member 15-like n=1 Tax=Hylobates moloch TaxID=81572 RepID=UPI0013629498|nr:neuroblastoma breakpoint family member 15-like [Hylobates moloch]